MKILTAIAAGGFAVSMACASLPDSKPNYALITTDLSGSDLAFFNGAAGGAALIAQLSDLAKTRAVTPAVQALAAVAAKEQLDVATRLKDLASARQVRLPDVSGGEDRKIVESVGQLQGPRFDKSYLDALKEAQEDLETALDAGVESSDKDIKAFAREGLDILKQEHARVERLGI